MRPATLPQLPPARRPRRPTAATRRRPPPATRPTRPPTRTSMRTPTRTWTRTPTSPATRRPTARRPNRLPMRPRPSASPLPSSPSSSPLLRSSSTRRRTRTASPSPRLPSPTPSEARTATTVVRSAKPPTRTRMRREPRAKPQRRPATRPAKLAGRPARPPAQRSITGSRAADPLDPTKEPEAASRKRRRFAVSDGWTRRDRSGPLPAGGEMLHEILRVLDDRDQVGRAHPALPRQTQERESRHVRHAALVDRHARVLEDRQLDPVEREPIAARPEDGR